MGAAAIPLIVAGSTISAIGTYNQGKAAYQASIYNAGILEQNAQLAKQQASEDERRQRVTAQKQLGNIRAQYGASGVSLEGSAQDVLEESAANAELDALTIRYQGLAKSNAYLNEAKSQRYQGAQAFRAAKLSAAGTLLSGAGQSAALTMR